MTSDVATLSPPDAEDLAAMRGFYEARYLLGGCAHVAVALHRKLGEPIAVATRDGTMVHAGTVTREGAYRDVRGTGDEAWFLAPFALAGDVAVSGEAGLAQACLAAGGRPPDDGQVAAASAALALLFPDLPFAAERRERVGAFARDLADLCRAHGLYLREAFPNGMIAYDAYGDEGGFAFRQVSPGAMVVTRVLGEAG